MDLIVQKTSELRGWVRVPGSKSQSIRGIFIASLAVGESTLTNFLVSEDTQNAINICKQLGATITVQNNQLVIKSQGLPFQSNAGAINSGNSGITTRFVIPLLGFRQNTQQRSILDCGEQMRARQVRPLVDALKHLGLTIEYLGKDGFLPLAVSGSLQGGTAEIDGIASQYLSALLISLPCAPKDSEIKVKNLHDRPYIEMTLSWLDKQKIIYTHQNRKNIDIYTIQGRQTYKNFCATITGDFSSASYLIAAAVLIPGCVELQGLDMQDPQGDKRLVSILQNMGADIKVNSSGLIIRGGNNLKGLKIDAHDIPDLVPTLAVVGTQAVGKTEIGNVRQARLKETDRIHSMVTGLKRLAARLDEHEDGMTIYQSKLHGTRTEGFGDHRTAMALVLAGMLADGATIVEDGEAINKTFPAFVEIMQSLGAKINEKNIVASRS